MMMQTMDARAENTFPAPFESYTIVCRTLGASIRILSLPSFYPQIPFLYLVPAAVKMLNTSEILLIAMPASISPYLMPCLSLP